MAGNPGMPTQVVIDPSINVNVSVPDGAGQTTFSPVQGLTNGTVQPDTRGSTTTVNTVVMDAPTAQPEEMLEVRGPANLRQAKLTNADRRNFDFTDADMFQARMSGGDFTEANFSGANLKGIAASKATFYHATLNRAVGDVLTNLSGANMRQVVMREARFYGTNFARADLRNADLRNSDLSKANLSYADLRCADLRGADLSSAKLSHANLTGAQLPPPANMVQADLSYVIGLNSQTCS
jgi:uncharacterized protein YjbI with pentapeptide repeats